MKSFQVFAAVSLLAAGVLGGSSPAHAAGQGAWQPLETTAARTDNPLEGFMPFSKETDHGKATFPYTMEWLYLPLSAVVNGEKSYDWKPFERELGAIASRGHQAALRFYLDYPGRETGVPKYLLGSGGIDQSRRYDFFENKGISFSPDYNDPRIQSLIKDFAAAFGSEYDGDPRIGYITTGLVGFWGEQHTWPMNGVADAGAGNPSGANWMPERKVELDFYRAWDGAFERTRLLNRYPGDGLKDVAVGFYDDSFAVSTLPTTDWHFMSLMNKHQLASRWQVQPIGGEIQPPVQQCVFKGQGACTNPAAEDFSAAVRATHASWLINQQAYSPGYTGTELTNALAAHASLGYDFAASEVRIQSVSAGTTVSLRITNRGVAPFYYDWPVEFSILGADGRPVATQSASADLPGILPGETAEVSATLPAGAGTVAVRIPNVMPGGAPIRFANTAQDSTADGYLTLGTAQ